MKLRQQQLNHESITRILWETIRCQEGKEQMSGIEGRVKNKNFNRISLVNVEKQMWSDS